MFVVTGLEMSLNGGAHEGGLRDFFLSSHSSICSVIWNICRWLCYCGCRENLVPLGRGLVRKATETVLAC